MKRLFAGLKSADGQSTITAPKIGRFVLTVQDGVILGAGSVIGELRVLNTRYEIALPNGAHGRVHTPHPRGRPVPLEYGAVLLELLPVENLETADDAAGTKSKAIGAHVVRAPIHGIFYRRPSPDAPPYVEVGARLQHGQIVGLVEAMKTFNPVTYEGPDGIVATVDVEDQVEVEAGTILLSVS